MRHAQAEPPNWYPAELVSGLCYGDGTPHLIALSPKSAGTSFLNPGQNAGDRAETAMIVPGAQVHVTPWPQTAVSAKLLLHVCVADILT